MSHWLLHVFMVDNVEWFTYLYSPCLQYAFFSATLEN